MAGHSHSANIRHRKAAVDAKKGAAFSKHAKIIMTAARLGGGDPKGNPRLSLAIEKARGANMPKDKIERAIKKGTGDLEGELLEEVRYEAYGPGGVAILLDSLTDNRNRTASDLRHLLERNGGRMAEVGAVGWMFEARALVLLKSDGVDEDALTEVIMDLGAEDLQQVGDYFEVLAEPTQLYALRVGLEEKDFDVDRGDIIMIPQNRVTLDQEGTEKVLKLLDAVEEHDDIQGSHSNLEISDEMMGQLENS